MGSKPYFKNFNKRCFASRFSLSWPPQPCLERLPLAEVITIAKKQSQKLLQLIPEQLRLEMLLMLLLEPVHSPLWLKLFLTSDLLIPLKELRLSPFLLHLMKLLLNFLLEPLRALPLSKPKPLYQDMLWLVPQFLPLMLPLEMLPHSEEKLLVLSKLMKAAFKLLIMVKQSMLSLLMSKPAMVSFMSLTMSFWEHQNLHQSLLLVMLLMLLLGLEHSPLWSRLFLTSALLIP